MDQVNPAALSRHQQDICGGWSKTCISPKDPEQNGWAKNMCLESRVMGSNLVMPLTSEYVCNTCVFVMQVPLVLCTSKFLI